MKVGCPETIVSRLSTDGRTLVVAVGEGDQGTVTVRLLKVDVATGVVTRHAVSGPVSRDLRPGAVGVGRIGATVRVAWLRMPSPGLHPLSESLQVTDIE